MIVMMALHNQNIRLNVFAWRSRGRLSVQSRSKVYTDWNKFTNNSCSEIFLPHWEIFYENKWFSICKIPFEAEQDESAYCEAECYFQVMIQTEKSRKFFMFVVS